MLQSLLIQIGLRTLANCLVKTILGTYNGCHLENGSLTCLIRQRAFLISTPKLAFFPILVLVSQRERFGQNVHSSAPLIPGHNHKSVLVSQSQISSGDTVTNQ